VCLPTEISPKGSLHILRCGSTKTVFEWTGTAWSTPNTGYSTRPSAMHTLGWKYVGPVVDNAK
jgi:hypothetical protein